ncbi:hypothetical protein AN214_01231 [Pseudoalteromonas sp. P1-9]|nr:hypothetical protein AN214_01231 [Pseudoalteromonas sp. P1-9]
MHFLTMYALSMSDRVARTPDNLCSEILTFLDHSYTESGTDSH